MWRSRAKCRWAWRCRRWAWCGCQWVWWVWTHGGGVVTGWLAAAGTHPWRRCRCLGRRRGMREGFGHVRGGGGWRRGRGGCPGCVWVVRRILCHDRSEFFLFSLWKMQEKSGCDNVTVMCLLLVFTQLVTPHITWTGTLCILCAGNNSVNRDNIICLHTLVIVKLGFLKQFQIENTGGKDERMWERHVNPKRSNDQITIVRIILHTIFV